MSTTPCPVDPRRFEAVTRKKVKWSKRRALEKMPLLGSAEVDLGWDSRAQWRHSRLEKGCSAPGPCQGYQTHISLIASPNNPQHRAVIIIRAWHSRRRRRLKLDVTHIELPCSGHLAECSPLDISCRVIHTCSRLTIASSAGPTALWWNAPMWVVLCPVISSEPNRTGIIQAPDTCSFLHSIHGRKLFSVYSIGWLCSRGGKSAEASESPPDENVVKCSPEPSPAKQMWKPR